MALNVSLALARIQRLAQDTHRIHRIRAGYSILKDTRRIRQDTSGYIRIRQRARGERRSNGRKDVWLGCFSAGGTLTRHRVDENGKRALGSGCSSHTRAFPDRLAARKLMNPNMVS